MLTMEYTNWRDREQARNLSRLVTDAPGEPLLVWYGGGHAAKVPAGEWITMGCHFPGMSGVEAFVIDQTVTVDWKGRPQPGIPELLEGLSGRLPAYGGTAGILRAGPAAAGRPHRCRRRGRVHGQRPDLARD
jgi:hypothetical protein